MATDPVCGMEVDPLSAMYTAIQDGETYYFCSEACKLRFQQSPERFIHTGEASRPKS